MAGTRRIARELALRSLFQIDVGDQPPDEAIEGGLQQISGSLAAPLHQAAVEVRHTLVRAARASAPGLSRVVAAASACGRCVSALEESLLEILLASLKDIDAPEPIGLDFPVETARQCVSRILAWPSVPADAKSELETCCSDCINRVADLYRLRAAAAVETSTFMLQLVHGVCNRRAELDTELIRLAPGWPLERMAASDRNLLRQSLFELLYVPAIPTAVTINEAVELANKYGTSDSSKFVNGVLGALQFEVQTMPLSGERAKELTIELDIDSYAGQGMI